MRLKALIVCERSGIIRDAFSALGHYAASCDLEPSKSPGRHYQVDALRILSASWDIVIAHPPCTYICKAQAWTLSHPADSHLPFSQRREHPSYPGRRLLHENAIRFAMQLYNAPVPYLALEQPPGLLEYYMGKPDQIIHPYYFGTPEAKETGLYLKNLPKLKKTNLCSHYKRVRSVMTPSLNRAEIRSETYPVIAYEMARQYTAFIAADRCTSITTGRQVIVIPELFERELAE